MSRDTNNQIREETQIIELLKLGDPEAVEYWFNNYQSDLTNYVASRVSVQADVKELVQDTFMSCLKDLPLFHGKSSLWTWMIAIARHEIADYYRKKYAKKALKLLPLSEFVLGTNISDARVTSEKVRYVLSQMSAASKELLLKKYVDGMKVAEIAELTNKTIKSVESELFRARNEFRTIYVASEN